MPFVVLNNDMASFSDTNTPFTSFNAVAVFPSTSLNVNTLKKSLPAYTGLALIIFSPVPIRLFSSLEANETAYSISGKSDFMEAAIMPGVFFETSTRPSDPFHDLITWYSLLSFSLNLSVFFSSLTHKKMSSEQAMPVDNPAIFNIENCFSLNSFLQDCLIRLSIKAYLLYKFT